MALRITQIRHPLYALANDDFEKWRICYEGGDNFINHFLQKFSSREGDGNFERRKQMAYNPAFAEAAINEIRNSIYQRMNEIVRLGGPDNYVQAIEGFEGGVDQHDSSMNAFIGQDVLTELLVMGKVGIFVDKQRINDPRLDLNRNKKPYLYYYTRENILSWDSASVDGDEVFVSLLLRTNVMVYDADTSLPTGWKEYYRHFWMNTEGTVTVDDWIDYQNEDTNAIESKKVASVILDLPEIPFVFLDIGSSLMKNTCNYQIALLNLASSDLNYALGSNFVFYTEQYDPISEQTYTRRSAIPRIDANNPQLDTQKLDDAQRGTQMLGNTSSSTEEVQVGGVTGRRYSKGLNAPEFISPSSEPLKASMLKQEQMKSELRSIINLSISNLAPKHASADSKKEDKSGLENGLSGIGLELEYGERRIGKIWALYENSKSIPQVNYPRKYDVKSDSDRQDEATALNKLKGAAPSKTYAKEIGKEIAHTMLSGKVRVETMTIILEEIDAADFITSDAVEIQMDVAAGLVDKRTASVARGYDGPKVVPIAEIEYTERMANIAMAQTTGLGAARGVGGNPNTAKDEKTLSQNPDINPNSNGSLTRT